MSTVDPQPGDYITYYDLYGNKKGFGIFVKYIENEKFPLTKKKIVLKNFKSKTYWSIYTIKFKIECRKHVSISEKRMNNIMIFLNNSTNS